MCVVPYQMVLGRIRRMRPISKSPTAPKDSRDCARLIASRTTLANHREKYIDILNTCHTPMSHLKQTEPAGDSYSPQSPYLDPGSRFLEDVDFASFVNLDATHPDRSTHNDNGSEIVPDCLPQQIVRPGAAPSNSNIHWEHADFRNSAELKATDGLGDLSTAHSSCTSLDGFSGQEHDISDHSFAAKESSKVKKSRRLPVESIRALRAWLEQHQDYPYPNASEVQALAQQSNLSKTQILNWFTNARRRNIVGTRSSQSVPAVDQTLLSPLERWQHSPPESEPAETRDIIRAAEGTSYLPTPNEPLQPGASDDWSSNSSGSSLQFGALSMSSYEHSNSSGSELSFSRSNERHQRPPTPLPTMRARRRRRKTTRQSHRLERSNRADKRAYQCTFCSDAFRNKYDWQRHEISLHIPIERWNCAPEGGIIEINEIPTCAFCSTPNPDSDHLETHDYLRCRDNPAELRAFSRKDHLQQHLRLVHKVSYHPSMDDWRESSVQMISRCGFCDSTFTTWEERVHHIAEHYKNNTDISQWRGGWGFEPHVESTIENAIPPYLLGLERSSMDPWTAPNLGIPEAELTDNYEPAPTTMDLYAYIHKEVSSYLSAEFAAGNNPSDEEVQILARVLAYGTDDPFNQTYADDPAFITLIRQELGIVPTT